jgi:hypothetical protein
MVYLSVAVTVVGSDIGLDDGRVMEIQCSLEHSREAIYTALQLCDMATMKSGIAQFTYSNLILS